MAVLSLLLSLVITVGDDVLDACKNFIAFTWLVRRSSFVLSFTGYKDAGGIILITYAINFDYQKFEIMPCMKVKCFCTFFILECCFIYDIIYF